jgi:hypothetical protein
MIIAASSAANLQAKLGLPLPNQIAGWLVLGMLRANSLDDWTILDSHGTL